MFLLRRAALAAVALSLVLAPATFAATASSTITETLAVNSSLTLTGCPVSIDFGAVDAGDGVGSVPTLACAYVIGGNATAWNVTGTQSALTSGSHTINAGNVQWGLSPAGMNPLGQIVAGTPFDIGTQANGNQSVFLKVVVNGGQAPGSYTGTFLLSVSGS